MQVRASDHRGSGFQSRTLDNHRWQDNLAKRPKPPGAVGVIGEFIPRMKKPPRCLQKPEDRAWVDSSTTQAPQDKLYQLPWRSGAFPTLQSRWCCFFGWFPRGIVQFTLRPQVGDFCLALLELSLQLCLGSYNLTSSRLKILFESQVRDCRVVKASLKLCNLVLKPFVRDFQGPRRSDRCDLLPQTLHLGF